MSETTNTVATPEVKAPKALKAPKVKKTSPAKPEANGKGRNNSQKPMNSADARDRAAAKACGLTLVHYRILSALAKADASGLGYRGIEKKTGYYSVLTAQLRAKSNREGEHGDSLGALGMVREYHDGEILRFIITAKGRKALLKAVKPA